MWSQQSPQRASAGSQCFCFLATKDHFSSNCTSRVAGGKSHEFVVGLSGVVAGLEGVANDGVLIDAGQASGLADAAAVLEVLEDGEGLVVGQSCAEQGGAFTLGEALLAGAAGEHAALAGAVAEGHAEIVLAAPTVVRALGILAAEQIKVFHEGLSPKDVEPVDNVCQAL
jgi:hypothetical protein